MCLNVTNLLLLVGILAYLEIVQTLNNLRNSFVYNTEIQGITLSYPYNIHVHVHA